MSSLAWRQAVNCSAGVPWVSDGSATVHVDWPSAVHALQTQLGLDVHPGAITAFELRGYAHYLALGGREIVLFARAKMKLPSWFNNYAWSQPVRLVSSGMFTHDEDALSTVKLEDVKLQVIPTVFLFLQLHLSHLQSVIYPVCWV